jgi:hypothetical protein
MIEAARAETIAFSETEFIMPRNTPTRSETLDESLS